jgi:hypothetical protein
MNSWTNYSVQHIRYIGLTARAYTYQFMVSIQIFGLKNSQAPRAAERFFKERRGVLQFVDLKQKAMAPGEIRRFIERFGLTELLDKEGPAYVDGWIEVSQALGF